MVLRALLFYLATSRGTNASRNPNIANDPEKGPEPIDPDRALPKVKTSDTDGALYDGGPTSEIYAGVNPTAPRRTRRLSSATVLTNFSNSLTLVEPPSWLRKIFVFIFPPKEHISSFIPHYRITPIISAVTIPCSILLELPGVTEHWYVRTEYNQTVESRPNTLILNFGLGISVACAVTANLCLIMRFLEKRVKTMTILCTTFLTIHGTYPCVSFQSGYSKEGISCARYY